MDIQILFPTGRNVELATTLAADIALQSGQLATDESLYTATVISLFTDARAGKDDELPAAITNRRGWWGDGVPGADTPGGDKIGSRLWLLTRRKQTEETRKLAIAYARAALAWTVEDGHAKAVHVDAAWTDSFSGVLVLSIDYERPGGSAENYAFSVPLGG